MPLSSDHTARKKNTNKHIHFGSNINITVFKKKVFKELGQFLFINQLAQLRPLVEKIGSVFVFDADFMDENQSLPWRLFFVL